MHGNYQARLKFRNQLRGFFCVKHALPPDRQEQYIKVFDMFKDLRGRNMVNVSKLSKDNPFRFNPKNMLLHCALLSKRNSIDKYAFYFIFAGSSDNERSFAFLCF